MRNYASLIAGLALMAGTYFFLQRPKAAVAATAAAAAGKPTERSIAAPGRVEPASEEIRIGSEIDGRLQSVLVAEGDRVRKGQLIATLVNADFASRIALAEASQRTAEASVVQARAALDRLRNGSRTQERREAEASVREADAVLANATAERDRRQAMLDRGAISRTEFDSADREYRVARARRDAVQERRALVDDATRPEDIARAEGVLAEAKARVEEARARAAEARALYAKTEIRSPADAVVLRRKLKSGESVSAESGSAIVVLGDTSRLRVRADIDENDVARLQLGQPAEVTAKAYGDKRFTGRIVEIGQILGRKNVRTDEPTERVDTKILETLIELDAGQTLPIGLRVDVYLNAKGAN